MPILFVGKALFRSKGKGIGDDDYLMVRLTVRAKSWIVIPKKRQLKNERTTHHTPLYNTILVCEKEDSRQESCSPIIYAERRSYLPVDKEKNSCRMVSGQNKQNS